jgi:hypothetical protein
MLLNIKTDLKYKNGDTIDLRSVCYNCGLKLETQLSHYNDNEILVIPHHCPTLSQPDINGIAE